MARYLLDTNVLSALVRDPHGAVMQRIAREGEQSVCTSIIVAAELRFGARKAGSSRLQHQVEAVLSAIEILRSTRRRTMNMPICAGTWSGPEPSSVRMTCPSQPTPGQRSSSWSPATNANSDASRTCRWKTG